MRSIGIYIAERRGRVALILSLAACLAAVMVATQVKPAKAYFSDPCPNARTSQFVVGITGQVPIGFACYDSTFGIQPSDSLATKQGKVAAFINACGTSTGQRNLAQAVVERTGNKPVAAAPSGVCNQALYETRVRSLYTGAGTPPTVDWTKLRASAYPNYNVDDAVHVTMNMCGITDISMAIIEVTGQLPKRGGDLEDPGYLGSKYFSGNGQCESTLYYARGSVYGGYDVVKDNVRERAQSTKQCGDSLLTEAYRRMTGWNPLPDNTSNSSKSECNIYRYNDGTWKTFDELKNYVYHSWRCENPWVGQVYAKDLGRKANGRGFQGECSTALYGKLQMTDQWDPSPDPYTFQTMRNRVAAVNNGLASKGWSFGQGGGGDLRDLNGGFTSGDRVLIQSSNGVIATGAGNVIANGAGNVIANSAGNVVNTPHGSVIANGAGNVIANGAGNFKAKSAGNVTAGDAGNLKPPTGGANIRASYGN